ncbi:MAG: hypothetical protein ACLUIX_02585 [Oscillospiraceae bacterium]
MSDILCLYYSRSGNTRQTMAEIAEALEAELVEFTDGVDRQGRKGYFRSGLDAMRRSTHPLEKFETAKPLEEYRLVILGSPVWVDGVPARAWAAEAPGQELSRVAYVLTRGSDKRYEEVYRQMDSYTAQPICWRHPCGLAPWAMCSGGINSFRTCTLSGGADVRRPHGRSAESNCRAAAAGGA